MKWWLSRGDELWQGMADGVPWSARFVYDSGVSWELHVARLGEELARANVLWDHDARGGVDFLESTVPTSISEPLSRALNGRAPHSLSADQQRVIDMIADAVAVDPGWISGRRLRAAFSEDPDQVQARVVAPLWPRYLERLDGTPEQGESYTLTAPGLLVSHRADQARQAAASCIALLSRLCGDDPDTLSFEWPDLAQGPGWEADDFPFVRHALHAFALTRWNQRERFGTPTDVERVRRLTGFEDFFRYVREDTQRRPWPTAPQRKEAEIAALGHLEDAPELAVLVLPSGRAGEGHMTDLRGLTSMARHNAAARKLLAYFYAGYERAGGRNFSIRPDAELLEELGLERSAYVAALNRLVDRGVLKFAGMAHGGSLTAYGIEVHEDPALLEEVLPVPSLTADEFRRLVVQAHVEAYEQATGGVPKDERSIRRRVLDAAGPRARDYHFDEVLRWMATRKWINVGAGGDVVLNASYLAEMRAYVDPLPPDEAHEVVQVVAAAPMRIVMLSSSPRDPDDPDAFEQLALDTEYSRIRDKLEASEQGRSVVLDYWPDVRLDQLADRLLHAPADVLHFSGHSDEDGALTMRDRDGRIVSLRPDGVARLIGAFADQLRCVVLIACHSDALAQRLREEIGVVVGMRSSVDDDAAIEFVCAFYNALARGHSVERAFRVAAGLMQALGDDTGEPVLYVRDGLDAAALVLGGRG